MEALPAVGIGNVAVDEASGVFTITFFGLLGGGAIPQLLVNNSPVAATPTVTPIATGGGTLTVASGITGTAAMRKERKGRAVFGGDNSGFSGTIAVNEGELLVASLTALGTATLTSGTSVSSGAAITVFIPTGASVTSTPESLSIAGTGYLNNDTGGFASPAAARWRSPERSPTPRRTARCSSTPIRPSSSAAAWWTLPHRR